MIRARRRASAGLHAERERRPAGNARLDRRAARTVAIGWNPRGRGSPFFQQLNQPRLVVVVDDALDNPDGIALRWMTGGQPFSGIHMASAGYFQGARLGTAAAAQIVDVQRLARERSIDVQRVIAV